MNQQRGIEEVKSGFNEQNALDLTKRRTALLAVESNYSPAR
jgi:hypothetical protein